MADRNIASDSHQSLSLDTLHHLPKDIQGPDSSLPLSPQWLLPKPGDMKHGMVAVGESNLCPYPGYASRSGISKPLKNGEDVQDTEKKRDVFRPSVHDFDAGRHERWRDEERDTNSAIRRDRRKDGEKEIGESRKMDRWVDNSTRHIGEPRRAPSDRWNDSNNRDANYDQRRDNKWSTRWGPDDKESESWREKLQDSGRDSELVRDKVPSLFPNQGKDDKELDQYRPWRSSSFQSRGRGEAPPQQNLNQKTPTFNYGRGRGEHSPTNFSVGRGRVGSGSVLYSNSSHAQFVGGGESFHLDPSPLRYSRIKLLDIYRTTEVASQERQTDGFFERPPSLTQTEALEPLALSAPTPEEMVILKGIDKGDIVSSGMPQASKEGPGGRSNTDPVQLGRTKTGSREDLSSASDAYKVESADNSNDVHFNYSDSHFEKYMHPYGSGLKSEANHNLPTHHDSKFSVEALRSDPASHNRSNEVPITRETTMQGSPYPGGPWRSESFGERSQVYSHDRRRSDIGLSHLQNDRDMALEGSSAVGQSYYKDQPNWQTRESIHPEYGSESTIKRQLSDVLLREQEARRFLQHTSPEDLSLYYKDPQGEIQGPFSGGDLIGWFEAGYFGIDLQVRVANALPGTPFASLGDVMPHLRAKAKAPPGFGAPKPNDISEMINRPVLSNQGKPHANSSEIDILRTDLRNRNESMTEAENKFLESLMSGSLSGSPLDKFASGGMQGYMGNNPVSMPPMAVETGKDLNYLLAQRMSLERQKSLPNHPLSSWPGRDAASVYPKSDIASESLSPHSKLLPSMNDNSRQIPHSQNVDLMSLLQGVTDKSAPSPVNNGISSWSTRQDKMDIHHSQGFPQPAYGVQQQRVQAQNQQPLTSIGQPLDNLGIGTPEMLLSSGLSQDPQMLSLLQQQYLMSQLQLQSQTPAPQQLKLLETILALKQQQQQQQEQQQKQLLLQQHLLSQALADKHSHQPHNEPYGHLQGGAVTAMNGPVDHVGVRSPYEVYQNNSQSSFAGVFPSQISQDVGHHASYEASQLHMPHQAPGNTYHNREEEIVETQRVDRSMMSTVSGSTPLTDVAKDAIHGYSIMADGLVPEHSAAAKRRMSQNIETNDTFIGIPEAVPTSRADSNEASISEQIHDTRNLSTDIFAELQGQKEQINCDLPSVNEIKGNETSEVKKVSEKKSKKQKNSKSSSSMDKAKGISQSKQSEIEGANVSSDVGLPLYEAPAVNLVEEKVQDQPKEVDIASSQNAQTESAHRAWKPAPGVKAKSLLEIQQEEARVAQKQISSSDTAASLTMGSSQLSWTGIVANVEPKMPRDNFQEAKSNSIVNLKSKSQLHDLLAEEVLAKSDEKAAEHTENVSGLSSVSVTSKQLDLIIDDDNFIQAKDSKKGRKKSAKVKGTGAKTPSPVVPADASMGKSHRQIQQEKEVLPAAPSGPSLGDFVLWKEESTNSSPVPAWSNDSGKVSKPTSLRDIQKEQGKRGSAVPQSAPIPSPQKAQPTRGTRGSGSSWTTSGTSPSKTTSPTRVNSSSSAQSKSKLEDDLFWGPLDQSKQESKQSGFPSLATPSNWGSKSTVAKGTLGGSSSRQKVTGNKPAESLLSSLPPTAQSSVKVRRDAMTKQSEAMDFRDWCESETVRLTGSKDTSFLEFCLKQSTSEAEILLIENLGSFDPDHEFIDKFLNYKELLSADVLEIAFQARSDGKAAGLGVRDGYANNLAMGDFDPDSIGSAKGGKKKGKKGKKVSPSVLGFNVVSNRIMMGEIQTVEE